MPLNLPDGWARACSSICYVLISCSVTNTWLPRWCQLPGLSCGKFYALILLGKQRAFPILNVRSIFTYASHLLTQLVPVYAESAQLTNNPAALRYNCVQHMSSSPASSQCVRDWLNPWLSGCHQNTLESIPLILISWVDEQHSCPRTTHWKASVVPS
jgi:hypothetical protein